MAQRTVSIVIEVTGSEDAARQVRQVRSAFGDLDKTLDLRKRHQAMVGDLDDFFRRILIGTRSTGDLFKNIWREIADFFRRTIQEMASTWATNLGGIVPLLPGMAMGMGAGGSLQGIGPVSGQQLLAGSALLAGLTVGSRNRLGSTLGGIGSGALTGFTYGGPIGAAIGAVAGGLAGFFRGGSGKDKQRDAEVANRGFAQLAQILEDYSHSRRDFTSAVDSAFRIWNQMQSQWVRPQSGPSQRPYFDAILRSMQQTEDERNRRRQLLALGPIPEFQTGGLIGSQRTQRGMLAVVHPGEFVMSSQAVDRLGVGLLDGLNRGSSAASSATGVSISLEPASAQTLAEMLKRNPQALEEGLLVVLRRGGPASRALRQ